MVVNSADELTTILVLKTVLEWSGGLIEANVHSGYNKWLTKRKRRHRPWRQNI
ncbi:hypothetical protein FC96_GL000408 [Secundilactobacillus kimchicus JCM 15530]|uniref:Uncharacterized protein n=1 Tax=Secundilactobacillus kimchicus JCM 15530 TaxID=1302272 RepID=A0A0R1HRP0_9LACO|nr:hypothetical protein FC96_GL000408 [Secundilactobacillus kimchicus JCM 15530]